MSGIVELERELYREVFALADYAGHSPGAQNVPIFLEMAGIQRHEASRYTVLDAGTGSGKGAAALEKAGFKVRTCDLEDFRTTATDLPFAAVCLWHPLTANTTVAKRYVFGGWVDFVYCTDVLEHIPTAFTMLAVARMLEATRHALFLSISLVPDQFGVWVGKPLHHTIQPFTWWRDNLASVGVLRESRDCLTHGLYLVAPR